MPTVSLFNEGAVRVDASSVLLGLLFSQSEDVLQAVQSHLHNLRVHHREQVTHGLYGVERNQIPVCESQLH